MELSGLSFAELGLLLVGASLVIVLLHLLRRPERTVLTPALFLWAAVDPDRARKSPWYARMRRIASLLLALALSAALSLALADPARNSATQPRDLVVLIDQSASMAARDLAPSRLASARRRAKQIVAELAPGDRALIAAFAEDVAPLSTFSADRAVLSRAIDSVAQSHAASDLAVAADFALDALRGSPRPELVILSDGNVARAELARERLRALQGALRFEPFGKAQRNVALTRFAVRRYPLDKRHHETLVAARNFGPDRESGTITLWSGSTLLAELRFELASGSSSQHIVGELPLSAEVLEARLELDRGADLLSLDDRAFATVPPRPRTRVLSLSSDNRFLEAALLLDDYLDVREAAAADGAPNTADFDVAIVDRAALPRVLAIPTLYLGEPVAGSAYPLAFDGSRERPYFERLEREHPLVRGLALEDVNIARAAVVQPSRGDVVVGGADRAPLLIEGARDGVPFLALPFDVRASDLPLRPAWPLLVLRALDRLSGEPPAGLATQVAGEGFALRVEGPSELLAPDGTRTIFPAAGAHRVVCGQAGVYRLLPRTGAPRSFAVLLPAEREGAIAPVRALAAPRIEAPPQTARFAEGRIWPLLVLLALALALLEWAAFHRRWST